MEQTKNNENFEVSSGNIFADLGLEEAEQLHAKASLAQVIRERIRAKELTQKEAAALFGTSQTQVSHIVNARIGQFTYDRLLKFIGDLDCDIEIIVKPKIGTTSKHASTTTVAIQAAC